MLWEQVLPSCSGQSCKVALNSSPQTLNPKPQTPDMCMWGVQLQAAGWPGAAKPAGLGSGGRSGSHQHLRHLPRLQRLCGPRADVGVCGLGPRVLQHGHPGQGENRCNRLASLSRGLTWAPVVLPLVLHGLCCGCGAHVMLSLPLLGLGCSCGTRSSTPEPLTVHPNSCCWRFWPGSGSSAARPSGSRWGL